MAHSDLPATCRILFHSRCHSIKAIIVGKSPRQVALSKLKERISLSPKNIVQTGRHAGSGASERAWQ